MKLNSNQVKLFMAEKVISTNDLAKQAGLSRVFMGECVRGKGNPKPATIGKIAKALNVPVTEIIETGAATPENQK